MIPWAPVTIKKGSVVTFDPEIGKPPHQILAWGFIAVRPTNLLVAGGRGFLQGFGGKKMPEGSEGDPCLWHGAEKCFLEGRRPRSPAATWGAWPSR